MGGEDKFKLTNQGQAVLADRDKFRIDGHKLMYHPAEVAKWLNGEAIGPIYVELSPVGYCNHRCTFCAVDYLGYKAHRIELGTMTRLAYEMAQAGVKSVMLAGEGEPLLHPDLEGIICVLHNAGLDIGITTNGVCIERLWSVLDKISWVKVSINGGPTSYEGIHKAKRGDYIKVINGIRRAVELRDKLGHKCTIGMQCVVLPDNVEDLMELGDVSTKIGADYIVFKPYSQHKKSKTTKYEKVKYDSMMEEMKKVASLYRTAIIRESTMDNWDRQEFDYNKCHATPNFWAYVMSTGDVYTCSAYLGDERFKLGNIDQSSFKEIWFSKERRECARMMDTFDISECRLNCRMNQCNKYLASLVKGVPHQNFI